MTSRLFDEDDEVREFEIDIEDSLEQDNIHVRDADEPGMDNDELDDMLDEFSYFQVTCRNGCGTFPINEANVKDLNLTQGYAEFRCPGCNEFQTSDLLIID